MTVTHANKASDAQIRELMDEWVKAAQVKDVRGVTAHHAPDVQMFDVINPLRYSGVEAVRKRLHEWFSSFQGPIDYGVRDLRITANDTVAFCHGLHHVNGTKTDGTKLDMWWRATVCFENRDGRWLVTHSHASVPFDMTTGKASLELKP